MIRHFISGLENNSQGSLLLASMAACLGGLLAGFTHCLYPVLPIIIAYVGAVSADSKWRSRVFSLDYALGTACAGPRHRSHGQGDAG